MSKFQVFKRADTYFGFRFKASNGEQILSSEAYTTKQNCLNGIAAVKRVSPYDSSYRRLDRYMDYRFNVVAENGEIIAHSSEGYTAIHNRENAINIVKKDAGNAPIDDLT
jgi:uncharacterized protein YegP (UPF0339 family)